MSEALQRKPWPIEFIAPEPSALLDICRIHDPEYVADVLASCRASGFGSVLRAVLEDFRPGIILYQAGADTHIDDALGGLLNSEQMRERDRTMFSTARELSIPLSWNLAGGYQVETDASIPRVVALHLNTFEEALRVWGLG